MTANLWLSLADLDKTFGGRRPLIRKLLTVFVQTYAEFIPQMRVLAQAGDEKAFAVQLHSLKGASASLGAENLRSRTAALEAELKAGNQNLLQTLDSLVSFWPDVMQNAEEILRGLGD